jgi:hypothetical protein
MFYKHPISRHIVDVFGTEYRSTSNGREVIFTHEDCGDVSGHLYVNVETGLFFCQRCEWGGKVDTTGFRPKPIVPDEIKPLDWYEPKPLDNEAIDYLRTRRISVLERELYGLCLSGKTRYDGLVLFPVRDYEGNYIGWQGRIYKPIDSIPKCRGLSPQHRPIVHAVENPKWFSSKGFNRRSVVYGLNRWGRSGVELFLAEAIISSFQGEGGLASFGKAVTDKQADAIAACDPPGVVVALDGDAPIRNWKAACQLVERGVRNVRVATLPSDPRFKDPASDLDWEQHRRDAVPFDFITYAKLVRVHSAKRTS